MSNVKSTIDGENDLRRIIGRFRDSPRRRRELGMAMTDAMEMVATIAKTKYLTGGTPLKVQTGRLRASVTADVKSQGEAIVGRVGTNVEYGRAHEYGADIPAMTIYAKRAKALRFVVGGKTVYAKSVNLPARRLPARPWLHPSADEAMPQIIRLLQVAGVKL